jgi:hypothetical protein
MDLYLVGCACSQLGVAAMQCVCGLRTLLLFCCMCLLNQCHMEAKQNKRGNRH